MWQRLNHVASRGGDGRNEIREAQGPKGMVKTWLLLCEAMMRSPGEFCAKD